MLELGYAATISEFIFDSSEHQFNHQGNLREQSQPERQLGLCEKWNPVKRSVQSLAHLAPAFERWKHNQEFLQDLQHNLSYEEVPEYKLIRDTYNFNFINIRDLNTVQTEQPFLDFHAINQNPFQTGDTITDYELEHCELLDRGTVEEIYLTQVEDECIGNSSAVFEDNIQHTYQRLQDIQQCRLSVDFDFDQGIISRLVNNLVRKTGVEVRPNTCTPIAADLVADYFGK